jgi:glutaredoxin
MKKFKYLFVLLVALLVLPFTVFADGEDEGEVTTTGESKEVHVYLFRGEGCPHCQEAEEWFDSIEDEYGSKFEVIDYETWNDADNAELMQRVAEARGETAEGVPYIIIGNKSWNGFAEDYEEEILAQIKSEFETNVEERYDIMKLIEAGESGIVDEKSSGNDILALILILIVVGGVCFGIYKASASVK